MKLKLIVLFLTTITYSQNRDFSYTTGTGFNATSGTTNDNIYSSAIQSDGKIIVAGKLSSYNGNTINNLVRINTNGTIDNVFNSNLGTGFNFETIKVALQTDGKIIVLFGSSSTNPTFNNNSVKKIIRLNSNGTIDNTFNYYKNTNNSGVIFNPNAIKILSDGKILVGDESGVIRVNSNGTLDSSFNTGITTNFSRINCFSIDINNKILVGGTFTSYNGQNTKRLIRLNSNGTIDNTFNIGTGFESTSSSDGIKSMVMQSDNKILIGGDVTMFNSSSIPKVIRLNIDGSVDSTLNFTETIFDNDLNEISLQSNGSFIVIGRSTSLPRVSIARFWANGQNDNSLNISSRFFGYDITKMHIQTDGKFILLGEFYDFDSNVVNGILRISNPVLSNENFNAETIKVYPNPVNNFLYIENIKDSNYEIYDITGKRVLNGINNQINVSSLENGVYFLKVTLEENILTQKFIKE